MGNWQSRNVCIQAVYNLGGLNFTREVDSLLALGKGRKLLIYFEESLFGRTVPEGITAVNVRDFCLDVDAYCS